MQIDIHLYCNTFSTLFVSLFSLRSIHHIIIYTVDYRISIICSLRHTNALTNRQTQPFLSIKLAICNMPFSRLNHPTEYDKSSHPYPWQTKLDWCSDLHCKKEEQRGKREKSIWLRKIIGPRRRRRGTKKEKEENFWIQLFMIPGKEWR